LDEDDDPEGVPPVPLALVLDPLLLAVRAWLDCFDDDADDDEDDEPDDAACVVTFARFDPDRYGAGSTAVPFTRVSKCTCGPVQLPVQPT
jgi:hypothetical protein